MTTRTCKKCGIAKEDNDLNYQTYKNPKGTYYTRNVCRMCNNARERETRTPQMAKHRAMKEKNRRDAWDYTLYHGAKQRAKRNGLDFEIDREYIREIMTDVCPVLGVKLQRGDGIHRSNSPSLDRVDTSKGYVKGNVRVISDRANRIKRDATLAELKCIVEYMESSE